MVIDFGTLNSSVKKYIALEGIERCGKDTVIERLKVDPDITNLNPYFTREPGGSPVAEILREIMKPGEQRVHSYIKEDVLLNLNNIQKVNNITPEIYFFLMTAARYATFQELKNVDRIISNRSILSTFAYQLSAQGLVDPDNENFLNMFDQTYNDIFKKNNFDPIVIWVEIDPKESLRRKSIRMDEDNFDKSNLDFLTKVHRAYADSLHLCEFNFFENFQPAKDEDLNMKIIRVDGMRSRDEVYKDIKTKIIEHFTSKIHNDT